MTPQQHIECLKMAFQTVGLGFSDEQVETIILTTQAVNKKKYRFTLMDAAKIRATIDTKYPPNKEPELFTDLKSLTES